MLWTIFVILFILWLLGLITGYTIGGFIHILLPLILGGIMLASGIVLVIIGAKK